MSVYVLLIRILARIFRGDLKSSFLKIIVMLLFISWFTKSFIEIQEYSTGNIDTKELPIPNQIQIRKHTKTEKERPNNCSENVNYMMSSNILKLDDVVINPTLAIGSHKGGETINQTINQTEKEEYFKFMSRFLLVHCSGDSPVKHHIFPVLLKLPKVRNSYTMNVIHSIFTSADDVPDDRIERIQGLSVGIQRTDYANLYWTMIELYSAYYTSRQLNTSSAQTTIFILDAHPAGHLDELWNLAFKDVMRIGRRNASAVLENFALVPPLNLVSIVRKQTPIPYIDDFRYDLSHAAGASPSRRIDCEHLKITLVIRKNYVAHPRNVNGTVSRQFANAEELTMALVETYVNFSVRTIAFETLSVREQVKLSAETDILIGVHGAGLAHTMLQIPGSGLIECFPNLYKRFRNNHMEELAIWSGKRYDSWYSREHGATTLHVPTKELLQRVRTMQRRLCQKN